MKLGCWLLKIIIHLKLELNDCSGEVLKSGEEWDTSLARETLLCATVPVDKRQSLPTEFSIIGHAQVRVYNDGEAKEVNKFVWRQDPCLAPEGLHHLFTGRTDNTYHPTPTF